MVVPGLQPNVMPLAGQKDSTEAHGRARTPGRGDERLPRPGAGQSSAGPRRSAPARQQDRGGQEGGLEGNRKGGDCLSAPHTPPGSLPEAGAGWQRDR